MLKLIQNNKIVKAVQWALDKTEDLKHTLTYIQSELNRIETIAGTLSGIEHEHYNKLTNFDHRELMDIAVEEQSAARQLGTIKQMCLSMSQKIDSMQRTFSQEQTQERAVHAETH